MNCQEFSLIPQLRDYAQLLLASPFLTLSTNKTQIIQTAVGLLAYSLSWKGPDILRIFFKRMKIMLWVERAMDVALRVLWHRRAFI
jgi:hypothetical protein